MNGMAGSMNGSAIVTGAARRIGRAIALRLAADGYHVILHASERSRADVEALADEISTCAGSAGVLIADLATVDPANFIAQAETIGGPLALLINNASVFEPDSPDTIEAGRWNLHFDVNLRAPVLLAAEFAKRVEKRVSDRQASIVNIIDQRVLRPNPRYFSYTLAKSALWTATQTMAQAFAPHLRVNAVGPGPVLPNHTDGPDAFAREAAAVPLERAVDPADIADAVLYLAKARSVTGQMICVDSGQHIAWKTPDALA